jgi:hypothetical protein
LEGLAKEVVGIFYVSFVDFIAIWQIVRRFGILSGYLVYFFPFWYVVATKIWQHCLRGKKLGPKARDI